MNIKLIIAIAAIAIIGTGVYLWQRTPSIPPAEQEQEQERSVAPIEKKNTETKRTTSLAQLIEAAESLSCTYTREEETRFQSGTVYVAGGKVRADITVRQKEGTSYQTHIINDSVWVYAWGGPGGVTQGTRMKIATTTSSESGSQNQFIDYDESMTYDCEKWRTDQKVFYIPANVAFTDASVQLPQNPVNEDGDSAQCTACDQVPPNYRAQCLRARNCPQ